MKEEHGRGRKVRPDRGVLEGAERWREVEGEQFSQ